MNLGIGEIIFILIIALIIFGPGNMVKTAHDAGVFLRKITKSPYWQEIWATKRELTEIPKILAKEAQLDQAINDFNKETKDLKTGFTSSVSDLIKEVNQPVIAEPASDANTQEIKPEALPETGQQKQEETISSTAHQESDSKSKVEETDQKDKP